jgi:hypothetical protein
MSRDYYAAELPDFEQRRTALEMFLADSGHLLDDPPAMRRRLMQGLAAEVLKGASMAFNRGETGLSAELADYAGALDPAITRSPHWWRVAAKRRLGPNAWRTLSGLARRSGLLAGS